MAPTNQVHANKTFDKTESWEAASSKVLQIQTLYLGIIANVYK